MNSTLRPLSISIVVFGLALIQSCKKDEVAIAHKVETATVSQVTITTAKLGGTITSNGGSDILAKGICFSTSPAPTVSNDTTNQGAGSSNFEKTLTDLLPKTKYYARAYARNKVGVSYDCEINCHRCYCTV